MNNFLWQMNFKKALEFCVRESFSETKPFTEFAKSKPARKQRKTLGWWLPGNKGKHWVGGGPTKNLSPASDKHLLTLLPTPEPLILLAGPVLPGNKGKQGVGSGCMKNLSPTSG